MTYRELKKRLEAAGISDAETDARMLLCAFAGASPAVQRADPDRDYTSPELERAVRRREDREPLQYLLGTWQFFGQTYEVSPDCLIPRADTEVLVEKAIALLPENARFADLCTGSGCIAVSVLAERPDTSAVAVEKFPRTLEIAKRNAGRNGVAPRFSPALADVLRGEGIPDGTRLDAILSNPPYIPSDTVPTLAPEVLREPPAALDGGRDGMAFYRAILQFYRHFLKPDGFFLFEIGYDEADAIRALAKASGVTCEIFRDLGGNDRVALIRPAAEQTNRNGNPNGDPDAAICQSE